MRYKSPHRILELTKGYVAIIDTADYRRCNRLKWHVHMSAGSKREHGQPYARAVIKGKKVYLHRFITQAKPENHVDHRNRQTLDCRRCNLEETTPQENLARKRKPKRRKYKNEQHVRKNPRVGIPAQSDRGINTPDPALQAA